MDISNEKSIGEYITEIELEGELPLSLTTDVARYHVEMLLREIDDAGWRILEQTKGVLHIPSHRTDTREFVEIAKRAMSRLGLSGDLTIGNNKFAAPANIRSTAFRALFPDLTPTSLEDGIRQTLEAFMS